MTRAEWARRKGRSSRFVSRAMRFAIYARDGFDCVICRGLFPLPLDGRGLTLEHVIPRSAGGTHAPSNLITCCARCNFVRGARTTPLLGPLGHLPQAVRRRVERALNRPVNLGLGRWIVAHRKAFK